MVSHQDIPRACWKAVLLKPRRSLLKLPEAYLSSITARYKSCRGRRRNSRLSSDFFHVKCRGRRRFVPRNGIWNSNFSMANFSAHFLKKELIQFFIRRKLTKTEKIGFAAFSRQSLSRVDDFLPCWTRQHQLAHQPSIDHGFEDI